MELRFDGRTALVTGAATDGMGRAIARGLVEAGADIALHHRDEGAQAEQLVGEFRARGRRAVALQADFASPDAARKVVRDAEAALGGLDIVVCTAAILLRRPALELSDAEWTRVATINLHAYFAVAQEAARGMVARRRGRIVMISSVNQWTPNVGLAAYATAKAGVMQLARSLALELAPNGVTVNLIAPGTIETDFNRAALVDPAYRKSKEALIPMARIGTPADIVGAALFLASDAASYVTGTTITVDGGLELRP